MPDQAALAGVRVIDLADEKGELCGRMLADLGADVIRVEPPGGARSRSLPPLHDDVSLYFAYRNFNKRGVTLDLESDVGRVELEGLVAGADVLIESFAPGELTRLGLGPPVLLARHPRLVVTSISDFGQTGPYRDWVATDAVVEAMGGMMWKAGVPERPPLIPPGAIAYDVSATAAAFATLCALLQRERTQVGQHLDVSCMEALAQTTDWSYPGASLNRNAGADAPEVRQGSGPVYTIYRCKGGFVRLVVLSPRQWRALWEWMGSPEAFAEPIWETFLARLQNADVLAQLYESHFAKMTMQEVAVEAQRRGIVCTPVLRPAEVLANEHLVSRQTFVDVEFAPGRRGPVAAGWFGIDGQRQGFRSRAPLPGEHDSELLGTRPPARPASRVEPPPPSPALAGLKALDFGLGGVGVEAARLLAEYGADVIKIESRTYPDFIRVVMGTEMSSSFCSSSRSKRGFGVNLKTDDGRRVVHQLIRWADLIIENCSTGTMDDMGVGWEVVRQLNPRCSMVSSQLLGAHGAWADWIGYGPSTQPVGGLVHLWNYPDREFPAGSMAIFPDHLAGRLTAVAALAATYGREVHGAAGVHADVAQIEAVTGVLGDLLLKEGVEPGSVGPCGNRSERGAPWGAYPCAGEQKWCVICVRDDEDWAALRRALGDPAWAAAPELAHAEGRFAAYEAIDAQLEAWTLQCDRMEVAHALQSHGVPAGPMLTSADQLDDPHLAARGYERPIVQPGLGPISLEGPAFQASGMSDVIVRPAPGLGEHTREICREILGLPDTEVERMIAEGALEEAPPHATAESGA